MGSSKNTEFYLINSFLLEKIFVKKKNKPKWVIKAIIVTV